jgi:branched-subunit amino acid aminotransferase/4-amino-4-deoxychorismate lyase
VKYFVNGRWCLPAAARVSVRDAGFAFGAGVFTTLRVHRGCPLFLAEHLKRLADHAARLGFAAPESHATARTLMRGLELNRLREGVARITATPGPASVSLNAKRSPTLVITFESPRRNPGPVSLLVTPYVSSPWRALKTTAYLDSVLLLQRARQHRCYDAVAQCDGQLLESGTANLFGVTSRQIRTPGADGRILPGIARARIMARPELAIEEAPLRRAGLSRLEGLFLTNCARGVIPVARVRDERGRVIWAGDPQHPRIALVRQVWRRLVQSAVRSDREAG